MRRNRFLTNYNFTNSKLILGADYLILKKVIFLFLNDDLY